MLGGSLVARAFASWSREELGLLTFPVLGSVPVALAGVFQRKVAKFDRVLVGAVAESRENILGNNTQKLAEGLNAHIFGQTARGFGPLSISFGLSAIEHTRHQLDRELNYRAFSPQAVQQILQALDSQDQLCDGIGHPRTIGDLVNLMVSTAGRNAAQ